MWRCDRAHKWVDEGRAFTIDVATGGSLGQRGQVGKWLLMRGETLTRKSYLALVSCEGLQESVMVAVGGRREE